EQVFLRIDVVVERPLEDPRRVGDVLQARTEVALFVEDRRGRVQDPALGRDGLRRQPFAGLLDPSRVAREERSVAHPEPTTLPPRRASRSNAFPLTPRVRNDFLSNFSVAVIGKASTNSTYRGTMYRGTAPPRYSTRPAPSSDAPWARTTKTATSSSPTDDGTPIAAAAAMPGWLQTCASSST